MTMQEVFDKLRGLQEVLSKKFEVQAEIAEIPRILATKTELLNRMKKSSVDRTQEHQAKAKFIEELRNRAIEAEAVRERFEQQMDLIQTQREYEALDKEIRDSGEKEQDLRRDLQKEEQALTEMKTSLEKDEAMIRKQEEEVEKEQAHIKEALQEKNKQLRALGRKEKTITPGLDEEILFKFERIIRSKSGLGIVPIDHGVCSGCHMILTGQYVNEVRDGDGIRFCPFCSRILFYEPEEDEVAQEEEEMAEETVEEEEVEEEEEDAAGGEDDE
jgi:predicted  nucleic acid-binding Zn-ribbon protein